jgi:hypothetical protein
MGQPQIPWQPEEVCPAGYAGIVIANREGRSRLQRYLVLASAALSLREQEGISSWYHPLSQLSFS